MGVEAIHGFWNGLPKLPADWFSKFFVVAVIALIPCVLYGQRLGQKAVEEGRARLWFGMVSNITVSAELMREARSGNQIARAVVCIKACLVVLFLVLLVWPKSAAA